MNILSTPNSGSHVGRGRGLVGMDFEHWEIHFRLRVTEQSIYILNTIYDIVLFCDKANTCITDFEFSCDIENMYYRITSVV